MLLVCGEDTNRFGQLEHSVVFFCFFFVKTWLPFMELVYSATLKKHIFRKSYSRTSWAVKNVKVSICNSLTVPADKVNINSICRCPVVLPTDSSYRRVRAWPADSLIAPDATRRRAAVRTGTSLPAEPLCTVRVGSELEITRRRWLSTLPYASALSHQREINVGLILCSSTTLYNSCAALCALWVCLGWQCFSVYCFRFLHGDFMYLFVSHWCCRFLHAL